MKNIIDKDISLFLPKKYKFLLLGGNFLLSKRLYEITKRQFEISFIFIFEVVIELNEALPF